MYLVDAGIRSRAMYIHVSSALGLASTVGSTSYLYLEEGILECPGGVLANLVAPT